MDGLHSRGHTQSILYGSTFDGAEFQITLSSDKASSVGGSAGVYKGDLTYLPLSPNRQPLVVAVKIFNRLQPHQKELLAQELRVSRMHHPFILSFLGTARDRHQEVIVSLYMRNGNLLEYFTAHLGCDKKKLILQVAEAVNYLHSANPGLVHGDLKCENVLVSDKGDACLADFGLSTFVDKSQIEKSTATGIRQMNTIHFAAPELLASGDPEKKPPSKTRESDVYAFGMLIIQALTERPPWAGVSSLAIPYRVFSGERPPRPTSGDLVTINHALWEACSSCWSHAPEDRPSMKSLLELLNDANFDSYRLLEGYTNDVTSVAYMPDRRRAVFASSDGTIRIWDTVTGRMVIGPLRGQNGPVYSVAVSPDGRRICSGGRDRTIRVWNAVSGAPIGKPVIGHDDNVNGVAFSPDGTRIVSCSDDGTVRLWNATTGVALGNALTGHTMWVLSVAFSPNRTCIASGSFDGTVRLWDSMTGEDLGVLRHPETAVCSLFFSPDLIHLVSGCADGAIHIWNISTKQLARSIPAHSDFVRSVVVSPSGRYIASGSDDKSIRIWNAETGGAVGVPLTGHSDWIRSLAFSSDGRSLVSGSDDCTFRVWGFC